ncbi:MAG: hypothetical protein F6K04_14615, partial [Leptolyngbya sp. SIO4C5]|nr:hypothetical protein [Leptolyngbya sp. SIO4C5]
MHQRMSVGRAGFRCFRFCLGIVLGIAIACSPAISNGSESALAPAALAQIPASATATSAESLLDQGRQHYAAQRFTEAAAAWNAAVSQLADQPLQQALALSYLTAAYQQLSQWEAADRAIAQSLDRLTTVPDSVEKVAVSAQAHNTLGSLQLARGQTQAALETWQIAADLYAQAGDQSRQLNSLLNQVQAQQSLGYYQQARNTLTTIEQRLPQQSLSLQVRGYQRLGQTYWLLGDLTASQTHLQKALELAQQANIETGAILLELANTAQAQGSVSDRASEAIPAAIALYQQAAQAPEASIRLKADLNRLKLLVQHNPGEAQRLATSLPAEIANLPQGRSQIYAYINAAQSLLHLETPAAVETSAHLLAQAVRLSQDLRDIRAEAYARGYLGRAYAVSRQWAEAQQLTEQALRLAQSLSAADITYQWQWQLGRLLNQQGQQQAALPAYRAAFATLQSLKQDLVAVSDDLQFSFRDSIEPVYRELVALLLQANVSNQKISSVDADLSSHQTRIKEAIAVIDALQVAELNNFFRTACLEAQQVNLENVSQTATAIIYPIILPDRLELIASLPGQPLQQYTSPVNQTELEQTLLEWRQQLEKPFTSPEGKALGQQLYGWLMQLHQPGGGLERKSSGLNSSHPV